jgi:hypothetical protein
MRSKIVALMVALYAAFTAGPQIQDSLDAWQGMSRPLIEAIQDSNDTQQQEQPQPPDEEQTSEDAAH